MKKIIFISLIGLGNLFGSQSAASLPKNVNDEPVSDSLVCEKADTLSSSDVISLFMALDNDNVEQEEDEEISF